MSDNIYEQNFYGYAEPGWHKKGYVSQVPETAEQAYAHMKPVVFESHPFRLDVRGKRIENNVFGIVRIEGNTVNLIGTTRDQYELRQPIEYLRKFDEMVAKPVETLGFLGANAEKLFTTWVLPNIDVHGDEVKLYGLLSFGFDGKYGNHQYVAGIRTVCENTHALAVADAANTENHGFGKNKHNAVATVKHNQKNHIDILGYWMRYVQERSEINASNIETAYLAMEETPLTIDAARDFFAKVYPYPRDARTNIPAELIMKENTVYANAKQDVEENRDLVMSLFEGAGIQITKTLWGAYNCVTEKENHHVDCRKNDGTDSILIGARGLIMTNAFNIAKELVVVR